jgi:hypothetical protein
MTGELLTPEDLDLINEKIRPENKRTLIQMSLFFLAFSFLCPFLPGKNGRSSAYESHQYFSGFLFFFLIFVLFSGLIYYKYLYCLDRDIRDGEKLILKLKISKRIMNRYEKYKLVFEKSKAPSFEDILIPKQELNKWCVGDVVRIELLVRSKKVLHYQNLNG